MPGSFPEVRLRLHFLYPPLGETWNTAFHPVATRDSALFCSFVIRLKYLNYWSVNGQPVTMGTAPFP